MYLKRKAKTKLTHLGYHPSIARLLALRSSLFQLPGYVQIEITTRCNFSCIGCMRTQETNSDITFDFFSLIINQVKKASRDLTVNLTGLGEPLLHPNLFSIIAYAKRKGCRVGFTSNFSLIDTDISIDLVDSGLDFLMISLDGATKQVAEQIRLNSNFDRTINNIEQLVAVRREKKSVKPMLIVMSTITEENSGELSQIVALAKSLDLDGVVFAHANGPKIQRKIAPVKWLKLFDENHSGAISFGNPMCINGLYVTFDGRVLPCPHLIELIPRKHYGDFQFGKIDNSTSLSKIWFSRKYTRFRANRIIASKCEYCPEKCPISEIKFAK